MLAPALTILLAALSCADNRSPQQSARELAQEGVLDLRARDWSAGPVNLNGVWEFYPGLLREPSTASAAADPGARVLLRVPGPWTAPDPQGRQLPEHGYGTYRLRALLPPESGQLALRFPGAGVSYTMFVNGREIARRGTVSADPDRAGMELYPALVALDRFGNEADTSVLELVIHISNYYHGWASGLSSPIVLGPYADLAAARDRAVNLEIFLFGAILIMGFYHLALYSVRRRDVSTLFFGAFCLLVAVRLLVTGERILQQTFPGEQHFALFTRLEYASVYLAAPLFLLFARTLFPDEFFRWPVYVVSLACGVFAVCVALASPLWFATYTMPAFQVLIVTGGLMLYYFVGLAVWRGRQGALLFLGGWSILFLSVIHDILGSRKLIDTEFFLPAGLFLFIFAQAAMLATRFAGAFYRVEDLTGQLAAKNQDLEHSIESQILQSRAFERFVPARFLDLLEKDSVIDVQPGDSTLRDMSVLFADIRSFTTLSEGMGPEASFRFLNQYLHTMVPVIEDYDGFVDKFLGDAIMALFTAPDQPPVGDAPGSSADRALGAALEMRVRLREFNAERRSAGLSPIRTGIGINTGNMMLGTVGSETRLDTTVIGNTVNMASRLESLTAHYGCAILISDFTQKGLHRYADCLMREVGSVVVKGRTEPVGIYEVYEQDSPESIERKEQTKSDLFMGIVEFKNREFERARGLFQRVLARSPEDRIAQVYLQRCEELAVTPPASDWRGVIEMQIK
jgi:class 3 adenylate cyclase